MFIDKRQQEYTSSVGAACLRLHTCRPYGAGFLWERYITSLRGQANTQRLPQRKSITRLIYQTS